VYILLKRQHKLLLQPFQKSLSLTMVTPTYLWMGMDQTSVNSSCCLSTLTPFVSLKCDMLVENGYTMWGIFTKAWTYVIVLIKLLNCRFSLSHHHQSHSTNKVKNQRGKRRRIFKQCRKDSSLCNVLCGRYSNKCLFKFIRLCMETPCLCPSEGHKYGSQKLTKT